MKSLWLLFGVMAILLVPTAQAIPPDLIFDGGTLANNSYTANNSWIYVHVSGGENLGVCYLNWVYNSTNISMTTSADTCYVNVTNLVNQTAYYFRVYGNDTSGNLNVTEDRQITINLTSYPDSTPPDITWNSPASNNTYTQNASWIYTNVTVSETPGACYLNVNSTQNYTMAISGYYCSYNLTGLVNNTIQKLIAYANDSSGNLNRTTGEWWVTANLTSAPTITFCNSCASCTATIAASSTGDTIKMNTSISATGDCIDTSRKDDIIFDCDSYSITGDGGSTDTGIDFNSTSHNNTLKNCIISNFGKGIYMPYSDNNTFTNITIASCATGLYFNTADLNKVTNFTISGSDDDAPFGGALYIYDNAGPSLNNTFINGNVSYNAIGVSIIGSDYNSFTNINSTDNVAGVFFVGDSDYNTYNNSYIRDNTASDLIIIKGGIYTYGSFTGTGNVLYNNVLNNTINLGGFGTSLSLNTTKATATNIKGGVSIGGNWWTNSTSNGYSDVCVDSTNDDICDFAYTISGSTDYLPLTNSTYTGINIVITSPYNTTYSQSNRTVWLNVTTAANSAPVSTWWYNNGNGTNITFTPNVTYYPSTGSNCLIVWANDSIGETNSSSICWSYYNWSSVTVVVNTTGYTNYTYSTSPGISEVFNLTFTTANGESSPTVSFSLSGDLANASRFIVAYENNPLLVNSASNNSFVNITANSSIAIGTYSGYIIWLNQNVTTNNGTIQVNITVAAQAAVIKFINTSWNIAFTAGSSQSLSFAFWNKGNYNASHCNITYSGAASVDFSSSDFTVTNATNATVIANWSGSSALSESAFVTITCAATAGGGITTDSLSGIVIITAAGGGGGGGGYVPPANITGFIQGDGICESAKGENTFNSQQDCKLSLIGSSANIATTAIILLVAGAVYIIGQSNKRRSRRKSEFS